jgi:RES domain-containing protein
MAPEPKPVEFNDVAFRYSNYDVPLWARANTRDGRWHRARTTPTQYLSLSVDGAWAELVRWENLRTPEELAFVRMPMWELSLKESRIADYASFDSADAAGFPPDALVDDDYSRCQDEGDRLRAQGYRGVMAPSASCPGEVNLTLFGPRVAIEWRATGQLLASFVPTKQIAVGQPPEAVLTRVRYHGQEHVGLTSYRSP